MSNHCIPNLVIIFLKRFERETIIFSNKTVLTLIHCKIWRRFRCCCLFCIHKLVINENRKQKILEQFFTLLWESRAMVSRAARAALPSPAVYAMLMCPLMVIRWRIGSFCRGIRGNSLFSFDCQLPRGLLHARPEGNGSDVTRSLPSSSGHRRLDLQSGLVGQTRRFGRPD